MASAKDIRVSPISCSDARRIVRRFHYSGKVVQNSQLHFGVCLNGRLEGAMQFGPSMVKDKIQNLVSGTSWNGFIELNRMAFSDKLPRNSESRALGVALRLIKKNYPHIEWVISFADAMQCGDGTIYRASGFVLTGFSSGGMIELPDDLAALNCGKIAHRLKLQDKTSVLSREVMRRTMGATLTMEEYARRFGGRVLDGFMFRYIYFLNPSARERLTVPVIPFSRIDELGGSMYKGGKIERAKQATTATSGTAEGQHLPARSIDSATEDRRQ